MSRRQRLADAALATLALATLALAGCASPHPRLGRPTPPPCPFATCGSDASSLARLTAGQLGVRPDQVQVAELQPQFAGAVLVWRAHALGRTYDCREGRDPRSGAVHYVDCRPSSDKAGLNAFP